MRNEIVCSFCGAENVPGDSVCHNCQHRIIAIPRWAQASGATYRSAKKVWAIRIAVGLILATMVWFNYPYVPNPVIWLFRSPSSDLTSSSSSEIWSMRGANPDGASYIAESSDVLQGTLVRSFNLGVATRSSPTIVDGVIYLGGDFKVTATSEANGETLWEKQTTGPVHGTLAVTGGNLYLPLQDKRLLALDLQTGAVRWEFKSDSPFVGSAVVAGGIVYAGTQKGRVYAVDAESGRRIWDLDLGSSALHPPAVYQGKVVTASSAGNIFVQNARTGDKRLRVRTGSLMVKRPVMGNGQFYVLSDGDLLAFDASARELPGQYPLTLIWAQLWIWQLPVPSPPNLPGFEWRVSLPSGMGSFQVAPSVTPEALYLGSNTGGIYALDPRRGEIIWQFQSTAPMVTQPIVVGRSMYFGAADGVIYAVDRFSGQTAWKLTLEAPLSAPLSFASGSLYAHTTDGKLNIIR